MSAVSFGVEQSKGNTSRVIAISSGKGGVGKSTVTSNLGLLLSRRGYRVLLIDGDISMSNLDLFFGVRVDHTLEDVIQGRSSLRETIVSPRPRLDLLPGASGARDLLSLNDFQRRELLSQVARLESPYDFVLIDTAPGIDDCVMQLNLSAHQSWVVVTPDPASITDAYAFIKVMHQEFRRNEFGLITNQVRSDEEGQGLFERLIRVTDQFLNVRLDHVGSIQSDHALRESNRRGQLVVELFDKSVSAEAFLRLTQSAEALRPGDRLEGGLTFFWDRWLSPEAS